MVKFVSEKYQFENSASGCGAVTITFFFIQFLKGAALLSLLLLRFQCIFSRAFPRPGTAASLFS